MTNPTLVTTPFAESGDKNVIPESGAPEPQNATMQAGFPPVTQQKISEGGIPPERNDFNGILNLYGQHVVYLNKGLPYEFDATFATAIGGYPLNARIMLADGDIVKNTLPNNTNNPNTDMTGWEYAPSILKFSEIADSIKRNLKEVIYDLVLDVTWFGAKADHSVQTGAGTVNDAAFQNCLSFIGSLGSIRHGGKVAVKIPSGPYQLQHLDIPTYANMGFGLEFIGSGQNSTALYFDESYTAEEAITCNMQFVKFRDMSINGALTSVAIPTGRTTGIVAKLLTNDADIDIEFKDCAIVAWNEFAECWGRGFVVKGCAIASVLSFLNIKNETYNDSTPTAPNNIMRHYRIQNSRIDAVSRLVKITGTNTTQQVNDIMFTGNDFYTLDILIEFPSHTISGLNVSSNNTLRSFATSAITGSNLKNATITANVPMQQPDSTTVPTTDGTCIGKLVNLTGDADSIVISSNVIKNLRENIIHVTGNSKGVVVTANTLPECYSRSNTGVDRILCRFDGASRFGNIVKDNACTSSTFTGAFRQTNIPLANMGVNIVKDNTSPWAWSDSYFTSSASVYSASTDITGSVTSNNRLAKFVFDGDYIVGVLHLSANPAETGAISVSLPIPAIAELPTVTSTFSGGGQIVNLSGFTTVGYVPAPVFVNAATGRLEFHKIKDLTRSTLNWSDGSGARTIFASFRYRYK